MPLIAVSATWSIPADSLTQPGGDRLLLPFRADVVALGPVDGAGLWVVFHGAITRVRFGGAARDALHQINEQAYDTQGLLPRHLRLLITPGRAGWARLEYEVIDND